MLCPPHQPGGEGQLHSTSDLAAHLDALQLLEEDREKDGSRGDTVTLEDYSVSVKTRYKAKKDQWSKAKDQWFVCLIDWLKSFLADLQTNSYSFMAVQIHWYKVN